MTKRHLTVPTEDQPDGWEADAADQGSWVTTLVTIGTLAIFLVSAVHSIVSQITNALAAGIGGLVLGCAIGALGTYFMLRRRFGMLLSAVEDSRRRDKLDMPHDASPDRAGGEDD